jgi:hypothetical protein
MKKIAFFVEGETEYYFISKLLKEIAGSKNINIIADKLTGGGKKQPIRSVSVSLESTTNPLAKYEALIRVSGTDNRVDTDIQDFHKDLQRTNSENEYSLIIGLRDLKGQKPDGSPTTLADLPKMERLSQVIISNCVLKYLPTSIIIGVYEIEAWFLAECTHYEKIDVTLINPHIVSVMGFNPCIDDMTLRPEPAKDLHTIYQLHPKKHITKQHHKLQEPLSVWIMPTFI